MSCFEKNYRYVALVCCLAVCLLLFCPTTQVTASDSIMLLHDPLPESRAANASLTKKTGLYVGVNPKGDLVVQHGQKSLILAYNPVEYNPRQHASINPESIQEPRPPSGGISLAFSLAFN